MVQPGRLPNMAITINGTTGIVSANIADGTISANDLASGAITSAALPAGSVIQVKHTQSSQTWTTTSTTFQMTHSATFDNPVTLGNKVLIIASFTASRGTTSSNWGGRVTIYRNSTNLGDAFSLANYSAGGIATHSDTAGVNQIINLLDTPDTTTPTYYIAHAEMLTGSTACQIGSNRSTTNYGNTGTMLTLMEIAG